MDAAARVPPGCSAPQLPTFHVFSSYFWQQLWKNKKAYNYKAVQRWTQGLKLQKSGQVCCLAALNGCTGTLRNT